jgi:glycosyltransferase involved in cell wall biosynthesis
LEKRVDQYADVVARQAQELQEKIDVIHAHDWMTFPAATKIARRTGKPFIAHIHSTEYDRIQGGQGSPYIHQQELQGMRMANRVIVVSNYTKHILVTKYGINADRIDVVHNGIQQPVTLNAAPKESPVSSPKRPVVVFMGRLTYQKGAEYFMQVARQVLVQRPDTLFVIAGDGDLYYQLLISAAGQALSASVVFAGFLRGKEKDQLLARATVFMMPSLSEPFGLVALEAAQQQTPVIVSKTAGVSEVLPSAIAIDFWDVNIMSSTLLSLLSNPVRRQTLVASQLKDLQKTSWQKAALNVREVYRRAFLG